MLRRKRFHVIYPEYFDADLPRSKGRRVPLSLAAEEPSVKKIAYACKKLGLEYTIEDEKAHPAQWWKQNGRVLIPIDKNDKKPKEELIKELSDIIRRLVKKKKVVKKKKKSQRDKNRTPPVR